MDELFLTGALKWLFMAARIMVFKILKIILNKIMYCSVNTKLGAQVVLNTEVNKKKLHPKEKERIKDLTKALAIGIR